MRKGLTTIEAKSLLKDFGPNIIAAQSKRSLQSKLLEQFSSFLIILLFFAAALSFLIGDMLDGGLIVLIILLNAAFGIYQESKAEEAVAALKKMTVSLARIIRDGKEQEINSIQLVPGDIILIEEGDKLPADAIILEAHALEINEASLTGESNPVLKNEKEKVFMGTIVSRGRAVAQVIDTGMKTKFGQIAEKLSAVVIIKTPLQKKLAHISEIIGLIGIILSLVVFLLSVLQGNGYFPSFLLAISLAVAVVPESLAAVMTVILSVGIKHMAEKNAIVRRLSAIESLGNTTIIATDKTGTLTMNEMSVKHVWVDGGDEKSKSHELLTINGVLCSTASLVDTHSSVGQGDSFEVLGDPTEGALLTYARKQGINEHELRQQWESIEEIPFDSVTKRMSVIVKNGATHLYSKGAPESILSVSSYIMQGAKVVELTDSKRHEINKQLEEWARHGFRVLAFAYSEKEKIDKNLVFLGMSALHDPPRPEVKEALKRAKNAGIRVVMITGDNEQTAESIGTSIGLVEKGDAIVTGEQIDGYGDKELMEILPHTRIFARTTPFHKARIVKMYQKLGEIVTVTGDGVNDAIALKQADVGVAMGKVGTDVARETADMVILDDNFVTIVNAVEEGRNITLRLKNSIKYLLTGNLSEGMTLLTGLLLGFPPILLPIQLLYINLISDGVPALAMAFSPKNTDVMKHKPDTSMSLLNKKDYKYIILVGTLITSIVMWVYVFVAPEGLKQTVTFSVMALIQAFIFIDIWFSQTTEKHLKKLLPKIFFITVGLPIVFQFFLVSVPFLASIFKVEVISSFEFIFYFLISSSSLFFLQAFRLLPKSNNSK